MIADLLSSAPSVRSARKSRRKDSMGGAADIVQFACPVYYCLEKEERVVVEIMRLGSLLGAVHVEWRTEDVSGRAGLRYIANSGKVTFEDGEGSKSIVVELLVRPDWCPTLEFKVELSAPDNCYLGIPSCSVKVIDNDVFPSNKYRANIIENIDSVRDVNWFGLFREYVKLIYRQRTMHWRTLVTLLFDQVSNMYVYLQLTLQAYLVNIVLNIDEKWTFEHLIIAHNRVATAAVIGVGYIVPMLFIHLWDYLKIKMDIEGHTRVFLSTCLFRKYLNYSEESRQTVFPAEMQMGLLGETRDLATGYSLVLDMAKMMGKLFILIFFIFNKEPGALWMVACMPVLMALFVFCRGYQTGIYRRQMSTLTEELIDIIGQTCEKYSTIRDYARLSVREEKYRRKASETRNAERAVRIVVSNNLYAAKWLGPMFVGIYIVTNSPAVLDRKLQLGFFLATISILGNMSDLFLDIYSGYQRINEMSEPLYSLSIYYNLAEDLKEFKKARDYESAWMREAGENVMKGPPPPPEAKLLRTDLIPIILDGITFAYGKEIVVQGVQLQAKQGSMVAIMGDHGSGKATLLKLLGRTMVPNIGSVLIPPHLRVLYVSQEPCILLDISLWENLTMGRPKVDHDRVHAILQEMGMDRVMDAVERFKENPNNSPQQSVASAREHSSTDGLLGNYHDHDGNTDHGKDAAKQKKKHMVFWFERLNYSEKAKIHLARAFIMNPEVMVMHRPMCHFDDIVGRNVMDLIKQHHTNRGLSMPSETIGRRRPRTVFMTTDAEWQLGAADLTWLLDSKSKTLKTQKSRECTNSSWMTNMDWCASTQNRHASHLAIENRPPRRGQES